MAKRLAHHCLFCHNTKLTREHVIPDWIQEIIPKTTDSKQKFTINQSLPSKEPPHRRPRHSHSRVLQGHPISRKIKAVCEHCNTGWMSVLEDELKQRLTALVLGEKLTLSCWDQRRVATWAVKTAMTAEFLDPDSAAIAFCEREYLKLHREPPKAFFVWAGHYDGMRHSADLHHHSTHLSIGPPTTAETSMPPNAQTTLIGLGRLFLQISSSSLAGIKFHLQDETVSNLRSLWPPGDSDLIWPPATSLSDDDIRIIISGINATFSETI